MKDRDALPIFYEALAAKRTYRTWDFAMPDVRRFVAGEIVALYRRLP